jgi:tRNA1Val (adenine37-N6)-methyltransferase
VDVSEAFAQKAQGIGWHWLRTDVAEYENRRIAY